MPISITPIFDKAMVNEILFHVNFKDSNSISGCLTIIPIGNVADEVNTIRSMSNSPEKRTFLNLDFFFNFMDSEARINKWFTKE